MAVAGQPIEAVLTLNASNFHTQIGDATTGVKNFVNQISRSTGQISGFRTALDGLLTTLSNVNVDFTKFQEQAKGVSSFNQFANGVKALANAIEILGKDSNESAIGMERVREIIVSLEGTFGTAKVEVTGLANALKELNNMEQQTAQSTQRVATATKQYGVNQTNVKMAIASASESLSMYHQHLRSLAMGIEQFNAFEKSAVSTTRQVSTATYSASESLAMYHQHLKALALGVEQFNAIETGHAKVEQQVANATNQATNSTNRATSSVQRQSVANRTATASTNQLTSATSRLGKAMSSLRMMGSLVGSMLAYNFAHKLLVATGETIHAKSEMEGYFKMLNFGQRDIDGFNKALDRTVAQFQRVNKYSLGETISSIGVEFNLSTKEMEKAMKVTSMITSEYLRAGRNANEASLAVKDVLQGQFQRLSRETGVKGEQLKDAGWSGDTTDVLGLMEALEKVGESRNWDVFAEKANSLNDILTITQNRFGEWSADLVYSVQPMIIGFFNMVMGTAQKFASVMSGMWEWLNSDDILAQITKWGSLATVITGVASAFVVYRTGANLVQVAQMGLTRTIASTILGLQAEQVAESGLTATIFSRITGLKAEQVATLGVRRAIMTKVLGLNAEKVATLGLKGAIGEEVLARRIQEASMKGATAQQMTMIYTEYQEQMAKRGTLASILAKISGVEMETFAEKGLLVALAERVGISPTLLAMYGAETEAELTTAEAGFLLTASLTPLIAIVGALVLAFGSWAIALNNSAEQMKKFNELTKNGADIIKENRKNVETYTKRQSELKDELAKTEKGTAKYKEIQDKLRATNQDLTTSNYNLKNSIKAVERANSAQKIFDDTKLDIYTRQTERLAQTYRELGFSMEESYELANDSMREANEGAEQLRETLQKMQSASDYTTRKMEEFSQQIQDAGITDTDEIKKMTQDYLSARDLYMQGLEKYNTDESFMGRVDGLLTMTEATIKMDLQEWTIDWDTGNVDELWKDIWTDLGQYIHPLGSFSKLIGLDELWKGFKITDIKVPFQIIIETIVSSLQDLGKYLDGKTLMDLLGLDSNKDYVGDFFNWLSESFWNGVNGFIDDITSNSDGAGGVAKKIDPSQLIKSLMGLGDSIDFSWATDYINNNIIIPLSTAWNNFMADPVAFMGEMGFTIAGFLDGIFGTDIFSQVWNWTNQYIIQPFGTAIYNGILSIPIVGDIIQLLGFTDQAHGNASLKGDALAQAFQRAVEDKVRNIPILGDILQFLGVIPQANPTANANGQGVGQNISSGTKSGMGNLGQLVLAEFNDALSGIGQLGQQAYNTARNWANQLWEGVNSILQRASPGFFHDQFKAEFGTDIPNAITSSGETAYAVAQGYAQNIKQGIADAGTTTIGMDGMVTDYQADAQIISDSSQMMGMTTTTAFNDMALSVNSTTSQMQGNVVSSYSAMNTSQNNLLNNMKQKNTSAYNEMYTKSNQSLIQMRDSTSNLTHQMTNAWNLMKNNIVSSANQLQRDSTVHFNTLSNTIGSFYRKIQNPSSWGAGPSSSSTPSRTSRRPSVGRRVGHALHGAGPSKGTKYRGSSTMTISSLKKVLCPNGDCDGIFDGYSSTDTVNVQDFLNSIGGNHGFGGWSGWNTTHYSHIKTKSDAWGMKSPTINLAGGIPTNADYKVGDFENGSPKISFGAFQSMAESIFSAIPYRHYMDSSWKGSWLGALQAGACNCSDGADALIAFAGACGFGGGQKVHGTWDGEGHFWAVINGKPMDTTAWQKGYGWTSPKVHGYGPSTITRTATPSNDNPSTNSQPVNITVNINEPVYGVDDLDSKISDSVDKGLAKHFNKSYAIGV